MDQPAGFTTRYQDQGFLLEKSISGLKQATQVQHMHLANKLKFKKKNHAENAFV